MHDKNAIEVRHSNKGLKIGMLSRQLAARLAPLIDAEQIDTEGVATDGASCLFTRTSPR